MAQGNGRTPRGQKTMANSTPVVLSSDQSAVPVSASSLPLPTGAATGTKQDTGNTSVASIDTKTPALGQTTMANSSPVTIANNQTPLADITSTGNITTVNLSPGLGATASSAVLLALSGQSASSIQITGTWVATLQFEATTDNINWLPINGVYAGASTPGSTITANGLVRVTPAGLAQMRIVCTAYTSGTVVITMRASVGTGGTFINQSLTAGTNVIGKVSIDQTTPGTTNLVQISGTVPVSIAGTVTTTGGLTDTQLRATAVPVSLASTTVTGSVAVTGPLTDTQLRATAVPVSLASTTITGSVAVTGTLTDTQLRASAVPVTGTITAVTAITNALPTGTNTIGAVTAPGAAALALDATLTGGTQKTKLVDGGGTNVGTIKAASTAAVATDTALVVALSPNNPLTTTPADITATGNITTQNLVPAGTATAASAVQTGNLAGMACASVQVTGTYTGALSAQATVDGSTWVTLGGTPFININTGAASATITSATVGIFQVDISGFKQFRITGLATMTGTATVSIQCSNGAGIVALDASLPSGTNVIGALSLNQSVNVSQVGSSAIVNGGVGGVLGVGGVTAAAATATGNPVRQGAIGKTANPTAVTDGQVANIITDKLGKQVVVGSIRDLKANQITTITASVAETTVVTAVAATFMDVYGVVVVNSSATAANVSFKDSTAGTTRFNVYAPAGETRGFMLPESGAFAQTTVNNNWTATSSASVSSLVITMLTVKNI